MTSWAGFDGLKNCLRSSALRVGGVSNELISEGERILMLVDIGIPFFLKVNRGFATIISKKTA